MKSLIVVGAVTLLLLGCLASVTEFSPSPATAAPLPSEEMRWVLGTDTALKAEAAASAADIAPLAAGSQVAVVEKSGRWLKVRALDPPQEGWVFAGRLSATPPVSEVAATDDLFASTAQQSQIETAQADSARSIRGLSPDATNYAKERGTPQEYRTSLDQILELKVSDQEVTAFMREGKLGEFGQ